MTRLTILTEADLRGLVHLDLDAVECIERAFAALASGGVVMPPILSMAIEAAHGEVDVKTAYVPGFDAFAVKISPGFFDNPRLGLPSLNGLMVLLSAKTGLTEALLLDNGYLTDVRTAAAGAVAARHMARSDARTAAILGAGVQARLQLKALTLVRPIVEARIWARDPDRAAAAAREMSESLGIAVEPAADPEAAVRGADVVVTTTPATSPILRAEWLRPGQHVTAMGSDAPQKNELYPETLTVADVYVADSLVQTRRLGELHHAIREGRVAEDAVFAELGDLVLGRVAGRPGPDAITVADLTGTGVQDTAIATLARDRARVAGAGTPFDS